MIDEYKKQLHGELRSFSYGGIGVLLLIAGAFYLQKKSDDNKLMECFRFNEAIWDDTIDLDPPPAQKDINGDSLDDIVLTLKSGEELVLYNTGEGYAYDE